jgi:antitoxin HicB
MSKNLEEYMSLPYTLILRRDNRDKIFVARVEELPGCSAHGDTEQDALSNLKDNMQTWIEDALEAGDPIPKPAEEVELPSGKWLQRVPRSLHLGLVRLAKVEGVSLNQLVTAALAEAVGSRALKAEVSQCVAAGPKWLYSDAVGPYCSGSVGWYDIRNEVGLPDTVSIASEVYLQQLAGVAPQGGPRKERSSHASEKETILPN